MKDPAGAVRSWLYGVLNTHVTYGGANVPVYSFVPKDAAKPYIYLAEQSSPAEDGTKDCYILKHNFTIEIYTSHTGNDASYIPVNTISDSVLQLIRTRTKITGLTGFNVISSTVESIQTGSIDNDTDILIYKIINIILTIAEE